MFLGEMSVVGYGITKLLPGFAIKLHVILNQDNDSDISQSCLTSRERKKGNTATT